jgi:hypothetical protein
VPQGPHTPEWLNYPNGRIALALTRLHMHPGQAGACYNPLGTSPVRPVPYVLYAKLGMGGKLWGPALKNKGSDLSPTGHAMGPGPASSSKAGSKKSSGGASGAKCHMVDTGWPHRATWRRKQRSGLRPPPRLAIACTSHRFQKGEEP